MTCTLLPYWYLRPPPAALGHEKTRAAGKMTVVQLKRRRSARVRTSSNPLIMGSCFSNFKTIDDDKDGKLVVRRVEQGLVEGSRMVTKAGNPCDVFLGIPYAKPPVGELRFQKPQPSDHWSGIRKCHKYPNRSIHREMPWDKAMQLGTGAPQSEDCLYLNVFAPQIREDRTYPVLFYIHGGGWMMDSAERYTPKNICRLLVSRDVIVVTLHYRLGFLGFLSTGDEVCPGNFGLYDMLEALKWTNANISSFGGDPQNITLSGQSAGAAAADLLSISPLSRGLFARKIVMGGNSYCHWATTNKTDIREYCKRKAMMLGWKPQTSYASKKEESLEMFEFFKKVPASKLGTTMWFKKVIFTECRLPLAPVVGDDILPDEIPILQKMADPCPSMVGGGEHEALLFYAIGLLRGSEKEINAAIDVFSKNTGLPRSRVETIAQKLYGDSAALRANSKLRKKMFVDMVSDVFANYGNYQFLEDCQKKGAECYAYSFDHQSRQMWGWLQHVVPFTGGTHTSDVVYLFDCNYMGAPLGMTKNDKKISHMTADYFTNFVKFGTPNDVDKKAPEWKPISRDEGDRMDLFCFKQNPEMSQKSWCDRMQKAKQELEALRNLSHV